MCNAYGTIGYSRSAFIHDLLGVPRNLDHDLPLKVARPTDQVPVIRKTDMRFEEIGMRWGLIPAWSKQMPDRPLTNARAETVEELRSFAEAFRKRRCILPASEFYEWTKAKRRRTFVPVSEEFLFAGLWEEWESDADTVASCVMLTTAANDVVAPVHDRMPVVIEARNVIPWLDPATPTDKLRPLLRPLANDLIVLLPDSAPQDPQTSLF